MSAFIFFYFAALATLPGEARITTEGSLVIECSDADPEVCAVALDEGQMAPFKGQLLSPKLAVSLAQAADGCEDRIRLALETQAKLLGDKHREELEALRPEFFERPFVVATLTAATFTLAILVGTRVP